MAYDPNNPRAHYNLDIRVPEAVIEEIRQLGMEGAIQKARSGTASPEFIEGVSRFYPNQFQTSETQEAPLPASSSSSNAPRESTPELRQQLRGTPQPVSPQTSTPAPAPTNARSEMLAPGADRMPPQDGRAPNSSPVAADSVTRRLSDSGTTNPGNYNSSFTRSGQSPANEPSQVAGPPPVSLGQARATGQEYNREPFGPAIESLLASLTAPNPERTSGDTLGTARASGQEYDRQPFGPAIRRALSGIGDTLFSGGSGNTEPYAVRRNREMMEQRNR